MKPPRPTPPAAALLLLGGLLAAPGTSAAGTWTWVE